MKFRKLSLGDKKIFNRYLNLSRHELSVYAFANIYIWKGLFDIRWAIIQGSLCVFFHDRVGCFLYLPPLGKEQNIQAVGKAFETMDAVNKNPAVSRIENVEKENLSFYRDSGYLCKEKSCDYLCSRKELADLKGHKYKHKRASSNYFIKNYPYTCRPFSAQDKAPALKLYDSWARERRKQNPDPVYQGMIKDSRDSLEILLRNFRALDLTGMVVRVGKAVSGFTPLEKATDFNSTRKLFSSRSRERGSLTGFTLGFKLNKETFCVLFEITDLSVKGVSQFIFKELCSRLPDYKYINIMDDSGLENLKRVKLSYHPQEATPSYIVVRADA